MNSFDRSTAQTPLQIGPVTRLLHRFAHLTADRKAEIVRELSPEQQAAAAPNLEFRKYVASLQPAREADRDQLAALWARIDAAHPTGPAKEGNQFLKKEA
ncbi:MAG TPA: hypothetical protein VMZ27_13245 [Candidatus Saccharimonadales bacterium]|nr:hypothetical protein [Candidatus Saccharimonadales bacterium]